MKFFRKSKLFWHGISIALPLFVLALVITYTNSIVQYFEDTVYENIWQEKARATERFAKRIDAFFTIGYDQVSDKQLFEDIVNTNIKIFDAEEDVFAVGLNHELVVCTERHNPEDPDLLSEPEFRDALSEALLSGKSSDFITVNWKNTNHGLYYQSLSTTESIEWIVIGLKRDSVIEGLNIQRLALPIFVIGIILIIASEYLIYVRTKGC